MEKDTLERFFWWMHERHNIYLSKTSGLPWPWTKDEILQTYKFTNVYRELDAGTIWLRENIREPYAEDPELFFNIATYRRYNYIGTAEILGYIKEYDADSTVKTLLEVRGGKAKNKIFTGAHMVCGTIRDKDGNIPPEKITQIFDISFSKLWEVRKEIEPKPGDTLQFAYNRLQKAKVPGYGTFINYEVVTDLRHTRYLNQATDIYTWANPGPGAKRGINRIYGYYPKDSRFDYDEYVEVMKWLMSKFNRIKEDWMPYAEMRDIEHSLCEFDKYERARLGQGKPREKYHPTQV